MGLHAFKVLKIIILLSEANVYCSERIPEADRQDLRHSGHQQ